MIITWHTLNPGLMAMVSQKTYSDYFDELVAVQVCMVLLHGAAAWCCCLVLLPGAAARCCCLVLVAVLMPHVLSRPAG